MRNLKFLHKTSGSGDQGCPAAYEVEGGYVIQGVTLTDPGEIAQVRQLADDEAAVFVPADVIDRIVGAG